MINSNYLILSSLILSFVVSSCGLKAPELKKGAEKIEIVRRCPPHNINWHTSIHQIEGCPYDLHYTTLNPGLEYNKNSIEQKCSGEGQKITSDFTPNCNQVEIREKFLKRVDSGECKTIGKSLKDDQGKIQYSKINFKPAPQDKITILAAKNADRKNYYENNAKNIAIDNNATHVLIEFNAAARKGQTKYNSGPEITNMWVYPFICK